MNLLHKSIAEFIGVFALVFAGCGAVMITERFPGAMPAGAVPVVFGLIIAAMIYAVGHISGAHFNPAVTIAFAIARHFPFRGVITYCTAQILGGIAAMTLLSLILPPGEIYGATVPHVAIAQAIAWEITLSFFLMFVIIAVATDTRAVGTMAGAAIGATVMLCAFIGGPVTGGSMNPARSIAPAIFENEVGIVWVYILGPIIGTVIAALTYEFIRCEVKVKDDAKGCC